ncbi:MAG: SRPBCC family protein [Polyangia bacterium]
MSTMPSVPSIRKQLTVRAPQERAFRVFAENMGSWWLKEHHIGATPFRAIVVEPKANGRWYELGEDGVEHDWGTVLVWNPPSRLVLGWQLNMEFKLDRTLTTEVEVTFTPLGPTETRVDFEHRNLERLGPGARKAFEEMDGGWGALLDSFGAAVQR